MPEKVSECFTCIKRLSYCYQREKSFLQVRSRMFAIKSDLVKNNQQDLN